METRGYVDLMTTFGQGKLSQSFPIRYLIVDAHTSYFALNGRKTLNELGAIVSTPHLKLKFLTFTREIVKVAPYPPIREIGKLHPLSSDNNSQVMGVDEEFPIKTLPFTKRPGEIKMTHSTWMPMMIPLIKAQSPSKSSSNYSWDLNPSNACNSVETSPIKNIDI